MYIIICGILQCGLLFGVIIAKTKKTPEMLPGFNSRDKTSSVSTRRFTRLGDVLKLGAQLANTDSLNRWINGVAGGRNLL